jgi:uncharacterized protein YuzE
MTITVDPVAEAAYVQLSDAVVAETRQLDDSTLVDFDALGRVVGIETLHL